MLRKLLSLFSRKPEAPLKDGDLDKGLEVIQTKLTELEHLKDIAAKEQDYVFMDYVTNRIATLRRNEAEYQVLIGRRTDDH